MAFEKYSTEILAWWVAHMDAGGCKLCPSTTGPETAALVRAEYATRPQREPRTKLPRRVSEGVEQEWPQTTNFA